MLRFAANISLAFREYDFYERFQRAADLGFAAIEFGLLASLDTERIVRAVRQAGLNVAMFSFANGNLTAGERGWASHPDKVDAWRQALLDALALADRLGTDRLNGLAGCELPGLDRQEQIDCLVQNLRWAALHVERTGCVLLLEALNPYDNPGYLLPRSDQILPVLDQVDSDWVQFQYDAYHLQRVEGDLVRTLRANIDRIGYVHVADNPGRHQPGTGEINYRFFFRALEETGYDGYVGLEYIPEGSTEASFAWLPPSARSGSTTTDELEL